ncbi:hypothetical protein HDU97_006973 [Phlyctochytrium planicorne]|nr:hypothetical protein HDU97_006973 [Phlyctochytrium planicorne]
MRAVRPGLIQVVIRVKPKASRTRVVEVCPTYVSVAVAAQPRENEANETLVAFIAKLSGVPKSDVSLVGGQKRKEKTLQIKTTETVEKLTQLFVDSI